MSEENRFATPWLARLALGAFLTMLVSCTAHQPSSDSDSPPVAVPEVTGGSIQPAAMPSPSFENGKVEVAFSMHNPQRTAVGDVPFDTEQYDFVEEEGFLAVEGHPLSTFSVDVDTASYANVRRILREGRLPAKGAVRIEELLNYFEYAYPEPSGDEPFSVVTEVTSAPWNEDHLLVMIGLQGKRVPLHDVPPRNLTFLLDVSGSMKAADKLPLVTRAMSALTAQLRPEDHVAIVVYAGASGLVLPPTSGDDRQKILDALSRLRAGGSTNGAAGIELAYQVARENFDPNGINRVILASDGDFNVGISDRSTLIERIERERESGVFLTVLGVGTGNLKDATMEQLADHGNGNYAYLDSLAEARKVLVEQAGATLVTLAKDVKLQLEFNPQLVAGYRLIGYENRRLAAQDFNDDRKDAGEIGAGHSVTALYELVPAGRAVPTPAIDPLRYQQPASARTDARELSGELFTVKLRYKEPLGQESRLLTRHVEAPAIAGSPTEDLQFASAVAMFGMLLVESPYAGDTSWSEAFDLARAAVGADPRGYRAEFIRLVAQARDLALRTESETEAAADRG